MTKTILLFGVLSASAALFGCSSDDEVPANPIPVAGELEIKGTWQSNFDSVELIEADSWTSESSFGTSVARIEDHSNETNEMVTQNADDAEYSPGLYNRIVWTELEGDSFYFCTTDFDVASAADAEARNTAADASDPDNSGCGDFSWTKLTRE